MGEGRPQTPRPARRGAGGRVDELASMLRAAPARAGASRVLAVDGRAGAGKSTLAAELAEALAAPLVEMEALYGGWDGLADGIGRLARDVLGPLAEGREALVPRYDWAAASWLEPEPLPPVPLLLIEGVGAGALAAAAHLSVIVWVEAPEELRHRRALARDGELFAENWDRWAAQEERYLASDRTPERADAIVEEA